MDIYEMPFDAEQYKLKTARQKKRLQKKDFDKQVIQIDKRSTTLWTQRRDLSMVSLEEPYQRGWKRSFVLRRDIERSLNADFYQNLLEKMNTWQYSSEKTFKPRKKRKCKKEHHSRKQFLREFTLAEWNGKDQKLCDSEKMHFYLYEKWDKWHRSNLFTGLMNLGGL